MATHIVCDKIPYPDRQTAEDAIKGLQKSKVSPRRSKKQPVQAYQCSQCSKWHLSSNKQKHFNKKHPKEFRTKEEMKIADRKLSQSQLIIKNFSSSPIKRISVLIIIAMLLSFCSVAKQDARHRLKVIRSHPKQTIDQRTKNKMIITSWLSFAFGVHFFKPVK